MNPVDVIRGYVRRSAWAVAALGVLRGLLQAGLFLLPFFTALLVLDRFFDLSSPFRKTVWTAALAGGLFLFVRGFWPFALFRVKARSRALSQSFEAFREDDLEIAFNFSQKKETAGVSDELKDDFLAHVAERLGPSSPAACFPAYPWKKMGAVFGLFVVLFSVLPLSGRVLFPFVSTRLRDFIEVKPGNAQVPFGSTVRVEALMKTPTADKLQLFVRSAGDWQAILPDVESAQAFGYDLKNVVQPLSYRVFWRGEWGERFTLEPVKALSVERFSITVTPPAYLGLPAKTQTTPEISGLAGSTVLLQAVLNRSAPGAVLVLPEGEQVKMNALADTAVEARFSLQKSGVYGFSFSEDRYPLQIRPDEPPTLSLLSPAEDLIVSGKDKLPVTYEAADDMGLGEINLIVEKEKGSPQTRRIQSFSGIAANVLATYEWDLGAGPVKPGDVFRFQLEAVDRNTVTGPGRMKSEWRVIEIASFEKSHETLAQILEAWREKALDLLGDVNSTRAKLDREKPDFPKLTDQMTKTMMESSEVEKTLEKIVSLMEKDPLADYGVWLEHKQMKENMVLMNQNLMTRAAASVQTGNTKEAAGALDQISSELERMLALSEDLSKKQRAADVMEMGENLKKLGDDMVRQLEQDPEAKAINRLLEEAQSILQQMAKAIQQFPKELPEDFVNQAALKNVDVDKVNDILSQIQDAMKKGDYQKAMSLAKQYLEAAKKMSAQLSEAYDTYADENSAERLGEEIEEKMEKLEEVVKKQRELLAQTQKLESERLKQMLQRQEKLLEQLYAEQMETLQRVERILLGTRFSTALQNVLALEITPMRIVGDELRDKKIRRSVEILDRTVLNLKSFEQSVSVSSAPVAGLTELQDVREREQRLLDRLKKPDLQPDAPSESQKEKFSSLKSQQGALGKETQALRRELQALSRKSASLNMSVTEPLSNASSAMEQASKQLGEGDSKNAQQNEEAALAALSQAGESLAGAQEMMSGMPGERGQPGSGGGGRGPRAVLRQSGGAGKGVRTGKVRLPTMQDYKPPKEFREELLESLKEKYPKVYEEIIHKYYKRLTD